jgi:peptidoglycan/LPS O-acetylase OafA/YrhL
MEARELEPPSPALAPPPGNPRFPLFDSLRGVAVLSVLTFHVASITGALNARVVGDLLAVLGNPALVLFYVISGFLLYRPFVAARAAGRRLPRLARYARRRVLRIVPGYWAALTLLAAFPGIVGPFSGDWWRYYLFSQLYSERTVARGIPVAWTLCVEVSFYVLLPLWAALVRRVKLGAGEAGLLRSELAPLMVVMAGGAAVQVAASRLLVGLRVSESLLGACVWLGLGMALAVASVVHERGWRWAPLEWLVARPGLCWVGAVASLVGLAAVQRAGGEFTILLALNTRQPVAKTLAALVLTGATILLLVLPAAFTATPARARRVGASDVPRRVLAARPLAFVGMISYGIYLWHLPIAELIGLRTVSSQYTATGLDLVERLPAARTPILLLATLVASCGVAALSYRLIELPFLRRKEG